MYYVDVVDVTDDVFLASVSMLFSFSVSPLIVGKYLQYISR